MDPKSLVGKTAEKAANIIIKNNLIIRIISIDDKVFHSVGSGCCKKIKIYKNRVNLKIKNGKVIDATIG